MKPGPKPGQKFGGRQKGTPNKDKDEIAKLIEAACPGWDPLQAMSQAAMRGCFEVWDPATGKQKIDDTTGQPVFTPIADKVRGTLLKEVNEYRYSKRRAIEVSDPDGGPLNFGLAIEFVASEEAN